LALVLRRGISARDEPTAVEVLAARSLRHLAVPRAAQAAVNPVPSGPEVLARARAHFADHCASCHGNDGRGQTAIGRNLYPRAPDMAQADTQSLSDGEIFSIIKNGVRLTGMPAWGEDTPAGDRETWELVHFIHHLPKLTVEELAEMGALNPRGREEWEQEEAARRFLEGGGAAPPSPSHHKEH
jgi:mono/diheme cytochrome c family protein